jgi:hypothetical protein
MRDQIMSNNTACDSTTAGVVSREELTVNRRFATPAVKKRVEVADREITFIKRHCRNTSVRIPYLSTSEKTSQTMETMRLGHDSRCSWVEREEIALPFGVLWSQVGKKLGFAGVGAHWMVIP